VTTQNPPAATAAPQSFIAAYRARLAQGWRSDPAQEAAVAVLNALLSALKTPARTPPKGVYLYGPVGRGKSELLALLLQFLNPVTYRRVHMHAFMAELHQRIHDITSGDPVKQIALQLASEFRVLGFDEFYVTNIADAMLLGRLFEHLFKAGAVIVATSNLPMDELFQNGRNRQSFFPFIRLIRAHLNAVDLGNGRDYRLPDDPRWPLYVIANGQMGKWAESPRGTRAVGPDEAEAQLEALFSQYAGDGEQRAYEAIEAKAFAGRCAWFAFPAICERALGSADYIALTHHADTIIVEGVPFFDENASDAALRLVSLIDVCYEQKRRVIVAAPAYPDELYTKGPVYQAFRRVASRLAEMQTWL
jgi:cell division protein ZapE